MIQLIDTGTHFDMIYNDTHTAIQFGEYALALANINYNEFQKIIESYLEQFTSLFEIATTLNHIKSTHPDTVKKYALHGIYPNSVKLDEIKSLNKQLYKYVLDFLDNGYLNKKQLHIITELILTELEHNIFSDSFNWQVPYTYVPSILHHIELREHLDDILLRNSRDFLTEIQDKLSQKIIMSSINIDKGGNTRMTYHINDTLSFLLVDLQKYLASKKTVIRCRKCDRLFYPSSSKNKLYCRLKHNDSKLTCAEIKHREPKDEFAFESKKARGQQHGFIKNALAHKDNPKYHYDYDLLDTHYQKWQEDCTNKMIEFRNSNDIKGFQKWIEKERLTVENLEKLGIRKVIKDNSRKK